MRLKVGKGSMTKGGSRVTVVVANCRGVADAMGRDNATGQLMRRDEKRDWQCNGTEGGIQNIDKKWMKKGMCKRRGTTVVIEFGGRKQTFYQH